MSNAAPRFSSRFTFLISALGIAIGTGNIWRFPRIVATNGGENGAGSFLVAWIMFLFLWSIPLIIAEYVLGRQSRKGTVGAFAHFMGKQRQPSRSPQMATLHLEQMGQITQMILSLILLIPMT